MLLSPDQRIGMGTQNPQETLTCADPGFFASGWVDPGRTARTFFFTVV